MHEHYRRSQCINTTEEVSTNTEEVINVLSEDLILKNNEVGEIIVKGKVVTKEYFGKKAATEKAKIKDPKDGGTWHRMGDLGYFDDKCLSKIEYCRQTYHPPHNDPPTLDSIHLDR